MPLGFRRGITPIFSLMKLVKHWNSEIQESGTSVTARNVGTNAEIPSTGEATFGFEATGSGTPAPRLTCRLL